MLTQVIRDLLQNIIDNIDAGNSNISEEEALEAVRALRKYTRTDTRFSKESACRYLNVSRATFDNYVRERLIPRGRKELGFKELSWTKKQLDNFKRNRNGK